MKLLIVISLKEYKHVVAQIFEEANIAVYSATDTIGFKDNGTSSPIEGWFAGGSGQFNSIFLFSFTEDTSAHLALELFKEYNESKECKFPIRAFIVPVEAASY